MILYNSPNYCIALIGFKFTNIIQVPNTILYYEIINNLTNKSASKKKKILNMKI